MNTYLQLDFAMKMAVMYNEAVATAIFWGFIRTVGFFLPFYLIVSIYREEQYFSF